MSPKLVQATNLDSVRIEVLGGSRALTIPANLTLAADTVMRELCMDTESRLIVQVQREHENGPNQWSATLHGKTGYSFTPWGAIKELADKIEGSNWENRP